MKRHVPNFITLLNLFCGCTALVCLFSGQIDAVFWLAFTAGWLDLGDGIAARLLNVKSELGKELDSLADLVTFGVLPGAAMFYLFIQTADLKPLSYALIGFLITLSAALRLAKFNLDTRQSSHFIGVPTPANTAFIIGWLMVWHHNALDAQTWLAEPLLLLITLVSAWLLLSELPMFSYKMKHFGWRGNEVRYLFIPLSLLLLPFFGWLSVPLGFVLYFLLSILHFQLSRSE